MNGKTGVPGGKPISRTQRRPYDVNLDKGFTAIILASGFSILYIFLIIFLHLLLLVFCPDLTAMVDWA